MSMCTILGDNTTRDCSEACNSTRLRLVQLQASEPVICGIVTQIAHLAMLLIILKERIRKEIAWHNWKKHDLEIACYLP